MAVLLAISLHLTANTTRAWSSLAAEPQQEVEQIYFSLYTD